MQGDWPWMKSRRYFISIEFPATISPSKFVTVIEAFCKTSGWKIFEAAPDRILAKRVTLWGNIFSFNIRKIICDAEFALVDGRIRAELRPDGIMQLLTGWNFASYQLELLELKSEILDLEKPALLRQFWIENNLAAIFYFVTLGLSCHKLPKKWEIKIQEYCSEEPKNLIYFRFSIFVQFRGSEIGWGGRGRLVNF